MSVFFSSRDTNAAVDSKTAILNGLAPDGGLYIPERIPRLSYRDLLGLTYPVAAARIISAWFDDMSTDDISVCCNKAYSSFDTAAVAPVVKAGSIFIVELFHGETCAFKDVALSLLPRLMTVARNASNAKQDTLILTATSGDTGSAAMNGFRDVDHTGIIVFYPYEGVSPLQRKQMVCMPGKNVKACAVRGNFDDCQSAVKQAFAELPSDDQLKYSSANSINIARLVPQIVYYFTAYLYLLQKGELKDGEPLSFIVPTGNFGDILAGYYAKKMGLPVGKLVCASNANRVLTDFIQTGLYDRRRKFVRTSSPSMDILISSNLERLLSDVTYVDDNIVREWMRLLNTQGYYQMSGEPLKRIQDSFEAYSYDDNETKDCIRAFHHESGYLADPHTAVALCAWKDFMKNHPGSKCAVLSTASPFKFAGSILEAFQMPAASDPFEVFDVLSDIGNAPVPHALSSLREASELHTDVIDLNDVQPYIQSKQYGLVRP